MLTQVAQQNNAVRTIYFFVFNGNFSTTLYINYININMYLYIFIDNFVFHKKKIEKQIVVLKHVPMSQNINNP